MIYFFQVRADTSLGNINNNRFNSDNDKDNFDDNFYNNDGDNNCTLFKRFSFITDCSVNHIIVLP